MAFRVNYVRQAQDPDPRLNVWNASQLQNISIQSGTPGDSYTLLYNGTNNEWQYSPGQTQLQTLTGNNQDIQTLDGSVTILRPTTYYSTYNLANPSMTQTKTIILEGDASCNIVTNHGTLNLDSNNTSAELLYDANVNRWIRYDVNSNTFSWFVSQLQQEINGGNGAQPVVMSSNATVLIESTPLIVYGVVSYQTTGAISFYMYTGGLWQPSGIQSVCIGTGAVGNANQGYSVAMTSTASDIVSGGPLDNGGVGAVWVFSPTTMPPNSDPLLTTLVQQGGKLTPSDNVGNSNFGWSVAISADGSTMAIGGPLDDTEVGATWIFVKNAGVWSQQAKLIGTGAIGPFAARQGWSVALSGDGNVLATGGPLDDSVVGAVWIFTRNGAVWTQQTKLVGTDSISTPNQGWSVSLSSGGNTLAVGGPNDSFVPGPPIGAVWIFTNDGTGNWVQEQKIVGTGYSLTFPVQQGWSVSLSSDGHTLAIGGPGDSFGGSVWIFTRNFSWNTTQYVWTQQYNNGNPKLSISPSVVDNFGWSVSLGGQTGNNLVVGTQDTGLQRLYTFV